VYDANQRSNSLGGLFSDSVTLIDLQVADEFRAEIESGIESMSKAVTESETEETAIDKQHQEFLDCVQSVERAIIKQTTELKQVTSRENL